MGRRLNMFLSGRQASSEEGFGTGGHPLLVGLIIGRFTNISK
jgi:hypothetical protein